VIRQSRPDGSAPGQEVTSRALMARWSDGGRLTEAVLTKMRMNDNLALLTDASDRIGASSEAAEGGGAAGLRMAAEVALRGPG
jgi:hypothetical protein